MALASDSCGKATAAAMSALCLIQLHSCRSRQAPTAQLRTQQQPHLPCSSWPASPAPAQSTAGRTDDGCKRFGGGQMVCGCLQGVESPVLKPSLNKLSSVQAASSEQQEQQPNQGTACLEALGDGDAGALARLLQVRQPALHIEWQHLLGCIVKLYSRQLDSLGGAAAWPGLMAMCLHPFAWRTPDATPHSNPTMQLPPPATYRGLLAQHRLKGAQLDVEEGRVGELGQPRAQRVAGAGHPQRDGHPVQHLCAHQLVGHAAWQADGWVERWGHVGQRPRMRR